MHPELIRRIQTVVEFSKNVSSAIVSDDMLFKIIQNQPATNIDALNRLYADKSGPVIEIRKKVIEDLQNKNLDKEAVRLMFTNRKAANPKHFTQYKTLYSILYPFIVNHTIDEVHRILLALATQLQSDLQLTTVTQIKVNGFEGGRNTGDDHAWFAIYNNTHPNQKTARQLFFSVADGKISYALYDRMNDARGDQENVTFSHLEYDKVFSLFQRNKAAIVTDNFRNSILQRHSVDKLVHQLASGTIKAWLVKPGQKASLWKRALKEENVRIGWGEVVRVLMKEEDYSDNFVLQQLRENYPSESANQTNNKLSILSFLKQVRSPDLVFAVKGTTEIIGVGVIMSDTIIDEEDEEFTATRNVDWLIDLQNNPYTPPWNLPIKTVTELSSKDAIIVLKSVFNLKNKQKNLDMDSQPLNSILYGPPGTGKTYSTIEKAINLCDPEFSFQDEQGNKKSRSIIKQKYDELNKRKRIFFTTFHQSLAYEDFIEGIKPVLKEEEEEKLTYRLEPGIFKIATAYAAYSCYTHWKSKTKPQERITFDTLYSSFVADLDEKITLNAFPEFTTMTGNILQVTRINKRDSIIVKAMNSARTNENAPRTKENLQILYDTFPNPSVITSLDLIRETLGIKYGASDYLAILKGLKDFEKTFDFGKQSNEELVDISAPDVVRQFEQGVFNNAVLEYANEADKVVIILDEINRGNIAAIFGELITLIEESKRWGKSDRLEAILPYSKKAFFVPANLHIIGTMNTADRSIEALDTALRRRFEFEELLPKADHPNIITTEEGIHTGKILECINIRLQKLLSRDHQIGHSYLLNVDTLPKLQKVFAKQIIPLLQEYFYNDFQKIGWVLGEGFFIIEKDEVGFASFSDPDETMADFQEKTVIRFKPEKEWSSDCFLGIYQSK